jgi:hypothetical protein
MEADQLGRLRDILQASRLIASYMKEISEAQFPGQCYLTTPTFSFAPMVRRPFAQPGLGQ